MSIVKGMYAERWWRWRRAGLDGLVSLKGGLCRVSRVVTQQLKTPGIVGFPILKYDAQTCRCKPHKTSAPGRASTDGVSN